ncbi:putative phage recombinase [Buttiauxella noackiae ATCC 51607]|uniref:Putative phage recombinase n=1 Tax=Buttiauxella noackiae ATCC 51607 TaxID=1354255 RepID=A0A1B7HYE3_9ENTR|nr:recombinase family protein [Buttiauxella noackiae]OAT20741.1 putative phage recombinase [Buttiauxella noackiae ATCC 51607]
MTKLYSYIRWSSAKQSLGSSQARQTKKAQEFAILKGLEYTEIFDRGVSAFRGKNIRSTAALGHFIKEVESKSIPADSWLYVENLDRLSRDDVTNANELFLRLLNLGLTIVTGMDNKVYTRESVNLNPADLMFSIMMFMRANEESRTKSARVIGHVNKLLESHKQGLPVNIKSAGNCPWWIDDSGLQNESPKPHPIYFDIAREVIRLFLDGHGSYRIAKMLNRDREKYPAPSGWSKKISRTWSVRKLEYMRRSKALTGEYVITVRGVKHTLAKYYPAVCTETEFARLQDSVRNNRITQSEDRERIALLSGMNMLRCANCGGAMSFYLMEGKIRYCCGQARNQAEDGCSFWSVAGAPIEHAAFYALMYAAFDYEMGNSRVVDTEALNHDQDARRLRLQKIDRDLAYFTEAISLGTGPLITLVEKIQELEQQKSCLLLDIDNGNNQLLLAEQDDVGSRITDIIELLRSEVLTDITHPIRLKVREIVRRTIQHIAVAKREDKSIIAIFCLPNGEYFIANGIKHEVNGSIAKDVGVFKGALDENGAPLELKARTKADAKVIIKLLDAEKSLRRKIDAIAEQLKIPPLNGKDFFAQR